MHVADLNWQQSPPKAVLSSGASSKTDSVQFTFPFFLSCVQFLVELCSGAGSFEPVAVALRSMLETVHGPFALAFWSPKCQAQLGPETDQKQHFQRDFETDFSHELHCMVWKFPKLDTSDTLSKFRRWFCSGTRLKVIYLCFGDATWLSRLSLRSVLSFVIIVICEALTAKLR